MEFRSFFTDLFTNLSSNHSWAVILYLLVAFLIGLLFAWLYWRRKWKNIKLELESLNRRYNSLQSQYDEQSSTLELKEADLKKARLEIDELRARIRQLEEEKGQLHGDLRAVRLDLGKLDTEKNEWLEKEKKYMLQLEDFDNLVLGLKTKNQNLAASANQNDNALKELADLQLTFQSLSDKYDALLKEKAQLEEEAQQQKIALGSSIPQADYDSMRIELDGLKAENATLEGKLEDNRELLLKFQDYDSLKTQIADLKAENASLKGKSEDSQELLEKYSNYYELKERVGQLETQVEHYKAESERNQELIHNYSNYMELRAQVSELQEQNEKLQLQLESSNDLVENYSDYLELRDKVAKLQAQNDKLSSQLAAMNDGNGMAMATAKDSPLSDTESASLAQAEVKAALGTKITAATIDEKDDLKLINGVGPFIEKKLNHIGIYTFEQISQFDDDLSNKVTDAIEFFPGRIQRDDWVGQAKALLGKKNSGVLGLAPKRPASDDLKVVEGIGPKIEALLKAGGINNWEELATSKVERLQEILDEAGDRYRIHDPGTWAEQARLAADGEWERLDVLQDELKGGRKV